MATKTHNCRWRKEAAELKVHAAELAAQVSALLERVNQVEHKLAVATKQIIGPKSERMPSPDEEANKREGKRRTGGHVNPKKRKENAEALAALPTTVVPHPIPSSERVCPHCGDEVVSIGQGERSAEFEWVPGRLERRVHIVEVGRCPCKLHYARGPSPVRVEGCSYGPAFLAKLVVDKCADATPIYRVEKAMRRAGIPIARSTMNDLVLLAGKVCEPLVNAMLEEIRRDPYVQADETSCRTQVASSRSFVWTFLSQLHTAYVFSPSRSGDTPKEKLGGSTGSLTVDGYTGYNNVTDVDGRERTGCWSHARRYLFEALATAPEAREGLDIILELFMVERKAKCGNFLGTEEHLELRKRRSAPVVARFKEWREKVSPSFEPKSPMGSALRYIANQWPRLIAFLKDARIPLHNNASESALRIVALMRKNSLFFGHDDAAKRFMALYSLIATCERHDINPEVYLADILPRVGDHPNTRLAELLPHRWKESRGSGFSVPLATAPEDAT